MDRDAKLLLALDSLEEAQSLVVAATEGLYINGKVSFAVEIVGAMASVSRMRSALQQQTKEPAP